MATPFTPRSSVRHLAWAGGLVLLSLTVALRAEESLKQVFTDAEYRSAGLGKLTPAEQSALLQALQRRGLAPAPAAEATPVSGPAATSAAASPAPAPAPAPKKGLWARIKDFGAEQLPVKNDKDEGEVTEIEAQMTEPFAGLQGRTLFHLDNGQVWQQRISETYYQGKPIPNPKVILKRTRFGYRLAIPAVGASFDVSVKRIQ